MDMTDDRQLLDTLVAIEERAWRALADGTGPNFYRENLTADAVMVFPFGTLARDAVIEAIGVAPPWATFRITEPRAIALGTGAALLTYRVAARREGQLPYTGLLTTAFVWEGGEWRTAFHQQTPTGNQ
jgi:hypothetical protein